LVTIFSEDLHMEALKLSAELREAGLAVTSYPEPTKIVKQFKFANKMGMKVALVLGATEVASAQVAVKDLVSGEQVTVARADVSKKVQEMLASI